MPWCSPRPLALASGDGQGGARRSELVEWYLGEVEGEIESVEELSQRKRVVEKVIDRLVDHVS